MQGLGRFAEDQHTGSEAVQAMHDEEIKAFEAAAAIGVRDGIRKIGIAAFFRRHREQARGLVHKEQMTILEEHFEIPARAALGFGQFLVDGRIVEAHGDGVAELEPHSVLRGGLPIHRDATRIQQPLGLPMAHLQHAMQLRRQGLIVNFSLPSLIQTRHGRPPVPGVLKR